MSGGHGNVADPITPIMADFPINAPSVWIGILATLCLACMPHFRQAPNLMTLSCVNF